MVARNRVRKQCCDCGASFETIASLSNLIRCKPCREKYRQEHGRLSWSCVICGRATIRNPSKRKETCSAECCVALRKKLASRQSADWLRLRAIWRGMKARCLKPHSQVFAYYGGRGIRMCDEWQASFASFYEWAISNGYASHLELDRRDTNGHYEPDNCRWTTRHRQMSNTRKRRDAKTSKFKGVSWCAHMQQWRAQCHYRPRGVHIGLFATELEAALAYDECVHSLRPEHSRLNFPERYRAKAGAP